MTWKPSLEIKTEQTVQLACFEVSFNKEWEGLGRYDRIKVS